ncbi:hypothetical protein GCM10011362_15360 [Marinobacter halophilus]|nr:hypothetical protein GCM10011362_15360 [Marinobacter halophilus]
MSHYDLPLVTASFIVAVLAAYTALFFGARLGSVRKGNRLAWLVTGGLAMGTGVWTMHFVGMLAMPMDMTMTFDTGMTFISWLAAVISSAIALHIIGREKSGVALFAAATLMMSGGIVVMHYLGMFAMKMSAPPVYDALWLTISVAIAVAASAAALAVSRSIRSMRGVGASAARLGAALAMATAICGMHYTGMLAMTFPEGAVPAAGNGLRGDWMGIPLAVFCAALLAVTVFVAAFDIRLQRRLAAEKAEEDARVARLAFVDSMTGLPNRSALEQRLLNTLALEDAREHPFALIYLDIANYRELSAGLDPAAMNRVIQNIAKAIRDLAPESVYLARYSASTFFLMVPDYADLSYSFMYKRLRELDERIPTPAKSVTWRAGQSVFPATGNSSRKLLLAAMIPMDLGQIGRFDKLAVNSDPILPGHHTAG